MTCLIPFLLYGLLLVSDTASQSLLDECVNETLTISKSCSAHPDQPDVFKTLSAILLKDIAILSLDIWNLNQSSPLYVFEVVMSDYGENVLRMKSYLEFLSIVIRGDNITRRSLVFIDEPVGCIFEAIQNDTDKAKTKFRDWLLCGFTNIDSDGNIISTIQKLCSQSPALHEQDNLGIFFDDHLYECCQKTMLNQTCLEISKDETLKVLYFILGDSVSILSALVAAIFGIYHLLHTFAPLVKLQNDKKLAKFGMYLLHKFGTSVKFQNYKMSTKHAIVPSSELINCRRLSMLELISRSIELVVKAFIRKLDKLCPMAIFKFVLVPFVFGIGIILFLSIAPLFYDFISYKEMVILLYCSYIFSYVPIICGVFYGFCKSRKEHAFYEEHAFGKEYAFDKGYVLNLIARVTYLPIYFFICYIFLAGSLRLLAIQILSFMVNTQDNLYRVLGSYCVFFIPFNLEFINLLRQEYICYLKLCMEIIIRERGSMNIYQYDETEKKWLCAKMSSCKKPLFRLENGDYAIDITSFVELCNLDIGPCPGSVFIRSLKCISECVIIDSIVFLIMFGLYKFGQVYAAAESGAHVISILSVISVLILKIPVFHINNRFNENGDYTAKRITEAFQNLEFKCYVYDEDEATIQQHCEDEETELQPLLPGNANN